MAPRSPRNRWLSRMSALIAVLASTDGAHAQSASPPAAPPISPPAAAGAPDASAEAWPGRQPIRVIVPFTAGSATDIVARAVLEQVGRQLSHGSGQAASVSVIVENRGGGGTTIGAGAVAKAEPDGYTLLVSSTSHVVVATTFARIAYSVADDFTAIAPLATQPFVVTTRTRYRSLDDLVRFGREHPGVLNYGSAGIGTSGMLFMERFALAGGFRMTHVPFRGTPEAMTEIIADRLDMYPGPVQSTLELARAGKVNALAVSTPVRSTAMPDVPTMSEAGLKDADYIFWIGAFAPARTPAAIATRLHDEIGVALADASVRDKLAALGAEPMAMTMPAFDGFVRDQIRINADILAAAGIKPQ